MSLDIFLEEYGPHEVHSQNVTHNLRKMAVEAGIYKLLWRPEEIEIHVAGELILPLRAALSLMKSDGARFREYDDPKGWGTYDQFVPWLEQLLDACERFPGAHIRVSR